MNRRDLISLLGGAAAWPVTARAQPDRMRRIGVLMGLSEDDPEGQRRIAAFQQALEKLGWRNGQNIRIDYRWAPAGPDPINKRAAELAALAPDVILTQSTPPLRAMLSQTRAIPIVFVGVTDPVEAGLVASLARPSGNATGFTNFEYGIGGKWVSILKEISPQVGRVLVLAEEENTASQRFLLTIEAVAPTLGMQVLRGGTRKGEDVVADIENQIVALAREPDGGLIYVPGNASTQTIDLIIALASKHRLPSIYPFSYMAAAGGLVSYGIEQLDLYHRAASYVDRILKGEKPADLPVQQPTKFELVINLKTAKVLGLSVPPSLLAIADEVIE